MSTITNFEDLEIWQLVKSLNTKVIPILEKLHEARFFELKNQLDCSAGSVMENIAEGFERDGTREFIQFLAYSKGSLGEVRSQLYRTFDRKCLENELLSSLQEVCRILGKKIGKFIVYLNGTDFKGNKFKKQ